MLLAYVWHVQVPDDACAYALTYAEAWEAARKMGWTKTVSWEQGLSYGTTHPSKRLLALLDPYLMGPGDWKRKVREVGTDSFAF
jgi:hypothetical protein